MTGFFLFFEIILPTLLATVFINDKSISPFFFCGVPTVINIKSQLLIEESLSVMNRFFFKAFFSIFFKFGSKNVGIPFAIFEHFSLSKSIPTVMIPLEAKTELSVRPTKPKPITAIFISSLVPRLQS